MIKIYADLHKDKKYTYIEDIISSHDLSKLGKEDLKSFITDFIQKYGEIHTCYSRFINVVGRYVWNSGPRWYGQEFAVYITKFAPGGKELKEKTKHKFDSSGRLSSWPLGYFE